MLLIYVYFRPEELAFILPAAAQLIRQTGRMLQTRISSSSPGQIQGTESAALEQTISSAIGLISRQYPVMIITVVLCLFLAGAYLAGATKRYTGTAVLMIDSRKMQ